MQLRAAAVKPLLTPRTVAIYASAPSFSFGCVDAIEELGALAQSHGCGLHVDNCLGGYLLSFLAMEDGRAHMHIGSVSIFEKEPLPEDSRLRSTPNLVLTPHLGASTKEAKRSVSLDMARQIAARHTTRSGEPVAGRMFPRYALGLRGVVGFVDVPGRIEVGDRLVVQVYQPPS